MSLRFGAASRSAVVVRSPTAGVEAINTASTVRRVETKEIGHSASAGELCDRSRAAVPVVRPVGASKTLAVWRARLDTWDGVSYASMVTTLHLNSVECPRSAAVDPLTARVESSIFAPG
jgi:hypothetical protein